jgi:hypothetical protein
MWQNFRSGSEAQPTRKSKIAPEAVTPNKVAAFLLLRNIPKCHSGREKREKDSHFFGNPLN